MLDGETDHRPGCTMISKLFGNKYIRKVGEPNTIRNYTKKTDLLPPMVSPHHERRIVRADFKRLPADPRRPVTIGQPSVNYREINATPIVVNFEITVHRFHALSLSGARLCCRDANHLLRLTIGAGRVQVL